MKTAQLLHDRTVDIHGWESRHESSPNVARQHDFAATSEHFRLMFRGQAEYLPRQEQLFLIGQKARPAYHGGDTRRLRVHPRAIAEDSGLFRELTEAFVSSPMHNGVPTVEDIIRRYERSGPSERMLLSQLLIYGLQYQNCRHGVRRWRDYLFVISCSSQEDIALRYALNCLPPIAFVLEYAPPVDGNWFMSAIRTIDKFRSLRLGYIYPDRDSEFFVNYGMFPHYLLGYSILHRVRGRTEYQTVFVANPWYERHGATLEDPPDLGSAQTQLMAQTRDQLAWITHIGDDFHCLLHPNGSVPLNPWVLRGNTQS